MAEALEDDWEHSVRRELAGEPSNEIKAAIKQLIKEKYSWNLGPWTVVAGELFRPSFGQNALWPNQLPKSAESAP